MGRRRALDGLRGVAVSTVVASHTLVSAGGGFLGVDVFFVLSGYLITSLMIKEWDRAGGIDLVAFYRRRAVRLAPAYLFMLALAVPMMAGPLRAQTGWPWPLAVGATLIYAGNWAAVINTEALGPIGHTWSLAIEEQFYLIWPAVFIVLSRRRRALLPWLIGGIAAIVAIRLVGWYATHTSWGYFATVTHGDGLLIGCLVAVLLAGTGRRATARLDTPVLAWASVAGLGGLMLFARIDDGSTYTGVLTLCVLLTALIVRHLEGGGAQGRMAALLSTGPLVAVGRVSYGLYLYHFPVFHLVGSMGLGYLRTIVVEYAASIALTVFSWYVIERPSQRWAARRWPRTEPAALGTPATSGTPARATPGTPAGARGPAVLQQSRIEPVSVDPVRA